MLDHRSRLGLFRGRENALPFVNGAGGYTTDQCPCPFRPASVCSGLPWTL